MRKEKLIPDHYYHIYNRGVNYGNIFFLDDNWNFFILRFRKNCLQEYGRLIAYCLMPNHYHLLIYIIGENFAKRVMQPFAVSYTKAINKQHKRVGPLFQGPFQSKRVDNLSYLEHLSRYIHRNPVAAGLVSYPAQWIYSSYQDYIGLRDGSLPYREPILDNFSSPAEYEQFVEDVQDETTISHLVFDD